MKNITDTDEAVITKQPTGDIEITIENQEHDIPCVLTGYFALEECIMFFENQYNDIENVSCIEPLFDLGALAIWLLSIED